MRPGPSPASDPAHMYGWTTDLTQENDGRIKIGNTALTSVEGEGIQLAATRPFTPYPLTTKTKVHPEEFEEECGELARRCGNETQRIEKGIIARLEQEEEDARRREKSGELMARLLAEGNDNSHRPGRRRAGQAGREQAAHQT